MEFLKAHYEKIILSVVLVGLAAAALLMPMKVAQERQNEQDRNMQMTRPRVKEFPQVPLTNYVSVLDRLDEPVQLEYSGNHNVFNPVRWQKTPDGSILKGSQTGVNALQVTNITALYQRLSYVGTQGEPPNLRYQLAFVRERRPNDRPTPRIAGVGERNNMFTIEEVTGDPLEPRALRVLIAGDKEPVVITPEKHYERIIGYSADFRYPPDNRSWKNMNVKDELSFGGETYIIVAITAKEAVVSARSNKKQTTLPLRVPDR